MITIRRRLIDIALNEFNYILDINLNKRKVEQSVSNIPQISPNITFNDFMSTFGSNVPAVDKMKCNVFIERINNSLKLKDYSPFVVELRFSNLLNVTLFDWSSIKCTFDTSGEDIHAFIISRDITVEKENELEVIKSSQKDSLTNLLNRYAYNFLAKKILISSMEENKKLAFFFIDIDNFKNVNDIFGHREGDRILKEVANLLGDVFKDSSIVCRYGGDEFIVIYPNFTDIKEVKQVGELICKKLTEIKTHSKKITISGSVGISIFPLHSVKLEELIHYSDLALYYAKHLGKNQYCIYDKNNSDMGITYSRDKNINKGLARKELLESILDNHITPILVVDVKNYQLIYANKAYCNLFEISEEDLYNKDKPCYSIIKGLIKPCSFCSVKDDSSDFEIVNKINKTYIRITKSFKWGNNNIFISYFNER